MSESLAPDEISENQSILSSPEAVDDALYEMFSFENVPSNPGMDSIVIATSSAVRHQIVSELLHPIGVEVHTCVSPDVEEEKIKKILQEIETPDYKYAARMSARKLLPHLQQIHEGVPTMTFDTVVAHDEKVLEKPKDMNDAKDMISAVTRRGGSANLISVYNGITFAMGIGEDESFYWRDSASISFTLKTLTSADIDEFLKKEGERVLTIAGGIDYSSESGHDLIEKPDSNSPQYIMGRRRYGQLYNLSESVNSMDHPFHSVPLPNEAFPVLAPYFKGVPTHIVKGLVNAIKGL